MNGHVERRIGAGLALALAGCLVPTGAVRAQILDPPPLRLPPASSGFVPSMLGPPQFVPYAPPGPPVVMAPPMLGVGLEGAQVWTGAAWEAGLRVTAVWPGYPAFGRLDPGDIILRANGYRTATVEELRNALAIAGPWVSLRVRDVRTGQIVDLAPIAVGAAPQAPAMVLPAPTYTNGYGGYSSGGFGLTDPGEPPPPTAGPPPGEIPRDGSDFPRFEWPPPKASAMYRIPDGLIRRGGGELHLKDVAGRLEDAFRATGYGEWSFYQIPEGFALVSRMEQLNADGTPKEPPDRWSARLARPSVFSLSSYLDAIFRAQPGYYRIVVFMVTRLPIVQGSQPASREEATRWPSGGGDRLPSEIGNRPYTADHACTALIYEFEQPTRNHMPTQTLPGRLTGEEHLRRSRLLGALAE